MKHPTAGHSSTFSLRTLDVERASSLRWARDRIVQHLNLAKLPRPSAQSVMVLEKKPGFMGGPIWPTHSEDTKAAMNVIKTEHLRSLFRPPPARYWNAGQNSLESTLVIAEHGTTSYGALYGHDGIVLLSIANRGEVKEVQTNLYATHYETYYLAHEDKETQYEGILHLL